MDKANLGKSQSLIQMLDAKCEERFERIESLIANMAWSVAKRKDREHDSSEDESHDTLQVAGDTVQQSVQRLTLTKR